MKTSMPPVAAPVWHLVDAEGQSLGRISAKIANVLRGKNKPTFSPHRVGADHVIVVNASKLSFPQKKLLQKQYRRHSGYLGHLKVRSLDQMMTEKPAEVIRLAVKGMLPSNRLRPQMLKQLHIYSDDKHTHEAQQPVPLSFS